MPKQPNKLTLLVMALVGGLVGLIAGLLLAPRSGRATRSQLKEKLAGLRKGRAEEDNRRPLSNWGNYPQVPVHYYEFEDVDSLRRLVGQTDGLIVRGNGRCYGNSALAPHVISTLRYDKFLDFDTQAGIIRCQSGVILADLLEVIVPQGWFLPVTPGTKLITVGGAIASDVHGKSQHKAGNFSDHLLEIDIMLADGTIATCSKEENPDLFWTTCGGMGLTGVILHATMQLMPVETAYFRQESIKAKNLGHLMDLFEESERWPYSVAWIDCLAGGDSMGRGILMRGEHARLAELQTEAQRKNPLRLKPRLKLNVPFNFPSFALNSWTVKLFNFLYFNKQRQDLVESIVDYNSFFYPLDAISNWNRIYGKRGFTQYQFILPKEESRAGLSKIIKKIGDKGMGSFLAVLKLYGRQRGYLPFAMEGYALALDFPITDDLFQFLDELDEMVLAHGGRLYLTKDVRMGREMFKQSYPQVEEFIQRVKTINENGKFKSFQSDRVGITS